jgi:hypothetical protein
VSNTVVLKNKAAEHKLSVVKKNVANFLIRKLVSPGSQGAPQIKTKFPAFMLASHGVKAPSET